MTRGKKKYWNGSHPSTYKKNLVRLKLLTFAEGFQSDLKRIRDEFGIPEHGFGLSEVSKNPDQLESVITELLSKHKLTEEISGHLTKFGKEIEKLGESYFLPYSFYNSIVNGLPRLVLFDEIEAPTSNWELDFHPAEKNAAKWISVKIYAPLSKNEVEEAMLAFEMASIKLFPKQISIKKNVQPNFERDLEIAMEYTGKAKKIKFFQQGSYMDLVSKAMPKDKVEKLARKRKNEYSVAYDTKTSAQIGKEKNMTSSAVRQALRRIQELANAQFKRKIKP